jgi:hypothetical protein
MGAINWMTFLFIVSETDAILIYTKYNLCHIIERGFPHGGHSSKILKNIDLKVDRICG